MPIDPDSFAALSHNPLRDVSPTQLEDALATAISTLVGVGHTVVVDRLRFERVSFETVTYLVLTVTKGGEPAKSSPAREG